MKQFVSITPDFHWELSCGSLQLRLILSCGRLKFRQLDTSCSCLEFRRLDTNCGWLKFRRLDTSYCWFHSTPDPSSCGCTRLKADSILWLTMSCGWFCLATDWSSGGWIRVTADSILWLTTSCGWYCPAVNSSSAGWTRLVNDLYFTNKFKDLFCKIHHFYGLFSTAWFQLPLIQALAALKKSLKKAWRNLRKLEEASRF